MKKHNLLLIILLSAIVWSCHDSEKDKNNLFSIDNSQFKAEYFNTDTLPITILNPKNKQVDSVAYYVNDKKVASNKGLIPFSFELKKQKLGYQNLKAIVFYDGDSAEYFSKVVVVSSIQPKLLKYTIVNTFPHDTTSFTEGLEFYNGYLYESTGLVGKSKLLKTDYKTGKIVMSIPINSQFFGEGITFINGKIFQLTWRDKTGLIYDALTMKLEKTFAFDKPIEGWGMTNDGKYIYQSDGTEKIWKMDPNNQKMIDYVNVYSGSNKIKQVNELEYINGKMYCNIWQKDAVGVVNPETGEVEGIIDFAGLRSKFKNNSIENTLNGIAYNPTTKTIFITGKNWDKIFEIRVN